MSKNLPMSWVVEVMPTLPKAVTVTGPTPGTEERSLSTSEATKTAISSSFPACKMSGREARSGSKWSRATRGRWPRGNGLAQMQRAAKCSVRQRVPVPSARPRHLGAGSGAAALTTPLEASRKPAAAISGLGWRLECRRQGGTTPSGRPWLCRPWNRRHSREGPPSGLDSKRA